MIQLNESLKSEIDPLNFHCQDCHLPSFKCENCYQLSFQCEHCKQLLNNHSVNIAIFLHGVFFLVGKDVGFIGFNCPKCLKTLLLKGEIDSIKLLIPPILKGICLELKPMFNQLRYFPSVNYSPKKRIPGLGAFDIITNDGFISHSGIEGIEQRLNFQKEELPMLDTDYLCSYLSNEDLPIGSLFSVSWFKEDQVEKLAGFENRKQYKVFPRYFYNNDLLDKVENFCWHNHLYAKFLSDGKKSAEEDLKFIANRAEIEGYDIDNIKESNPELGPQSWEIMQENLSSDFNWNLAGKFMEILVADPDPYPNMDQLRPNPDTLRPLLKGLWKSRFPFKDDAVPNDLKKIDPAKFDRSGKDKRHQEMVKALQENFHLKTVQTFLKESSQQFIEDYIGRAQDITFSYADLWEIKEKYLIRLFNEAKEKAHQETAVQHSFHEFDDYYEIFFEGERHLLDKIGGLKRLQYLVRHKYEEVSIFDMDDDEGIAPELLQERTKEIISFLMENEEWGKESEEERGPVKRNIEQEQIERSWNEKIINELRPMIKKWKTLGEDASVAEESYEHEKLRKIRNDRKKLEKIISMVVSKSIMTEQEKIRAKNIKHKINKSINEAIARIKDRKLREHFETSYKSVPKQYALIYSPKDDIDWKID
ncbi:MAG: hypothetical protein AB1427_14190 [Thermodesulfobacteriota bacterium]